VIYKTNDILFRWREDAERVAAIAGTNVEEVQLVSSLREVEAIIAALEAEA
jgi:hypothetical protein